MRVPLFGMLLALWRPLILAVANIAADDILSLLKPAADAAPSAAPLFSAGSATERASPRGAKLGDPPLPPTHTPPPTPPPPNCGPSLALARPIYAHRARSRACTGRRALRRN